MLEKSEHKTLKLLRKGKSLNLKKFKKLNIFYQTIMYERGLKRTLTDTVFKSTGNKCIDQQTFYSYRQRRLQDFFWGGGEEGLTL